MTFSASTRLLLPRSVLGSCVFVGVQRDTRGMLLSDSERFNYYPATPMGMISWIFEGTLHMVEERGPDSASTLGPTLPRLVFSGPQRRPCASWSPGSVHALSVAFYPEAMTMLLGTSIERFFDKTLPLESVACGQFVQACSSLFTLDGDPDLFRRLEDCLEPLWQGARSSGGAPFMGDWIRSLAARAAFSKAGLGVRQLQRRIKSWAGQSRRDLQLFARVEEVLLRVADSSQEDSLDLAGLATDAGFADQSHMSREVRRVTGFTPARLDNLIRRDESFWLYRLYDGHLHTR